MRQGRGCAIDTEPDMVEHLALRARRESLANLTAVKGEPADPRIPAKADLIIMVDVFHHVDDRERYFAKLRDSLKANGRVAIIDFRMDSPEGRHRARIRRSSRRVARTCASPAAAFCWAARASRRANT